MNRTAVLKRYVSALYDIAKEKKYLQEVSAAVDAFFSLMEQHIGFSNYILTGKADKRKKEIVLEVCNAFDEKMSKYFLNCLFVIIDNDRCKFLDSFLETWNKHCCEMENTWSAIVYTAGVANEKEKQAVNNFMAKVEKKCTFNYTYNVLPSLVGGFIIKTKNKIYDCSISGNLERLKKHLLR